MEQRDIETSKIIEQAPIGILTFSSDWKVDFVNQNFFRLGIRITADLEEILGTNILETELFQDMKISDDLINLKAGIPFEKNLKSIKSLDGGVINILLKASPVFSESEFDGGILILEDLKVIPEAGFDGSSSSEFLHTAFDSLNDSIIITDIQGKIKFVFGRKFINASVSSSELLDAEISSLFKDPDKEMFGNAFLKAVHSGQPEIMNIIVSSDHEDITYEVRIVPLISRKNRSQFTVIYFKDVTRQATERARLEAQLSELTEYQAITESVSDAVFALDYEGRIIFWNKASERLFGYKKSEVYGKFFGKILKAVEQAQFQSIKEELKKQKHWEGELTIFDKNDQKEIIEAKFSIADSHDRKTILVLCCNITERARIEKELRRSEERYRKIVTYASEYICNIERDGTITYANPAFINSMGYTESELIYKNLFDLIDPGYLEKGKFSKNSLTEGKVSSFELPVITKNGTRLYLIANFSPILDADKSVKYFNGIFTDVTDKKSAEKDLLMMRSVFKASQDGIAVECGRKFLLANDSFARIFNYESGAELFGKDPLDLVANDDIPRVAKFIQLMEQKKSAPNRYEFLGKRKDGSQFYAEASVTFFEAEDKVYIVTIARDITERKRAQQALKESEERYRNVTENIDDFLWTAERINNKIRPVFYTSSVELITGHPQTEFLADSRFFFRLIYPDDFPFVKEKLKKLFSSRIRLSDEFEFRIINKQGNVVWIRNKMNLIRNEKGVVQKIYGLVSNISPRKKAEEELQKSTENLIKLNETKDKFISIISHDLRTPFSSILGFTDLLLSDSELTDEEKRQYVAFIRESSNSMLSLVNSLLDWTRLQTGRIQFEPEKINITEIVRKSFNAMSGVAFQKNIELISKLPDDLYIYVDMDLILQVFNNLISNAVKFTGEGGRITVSAVPAAGLRFYEFSVKDTGVGIKSENLEKLFRIDSKFTSKGTAGEKGSGLGLSLCKEIIEKHSGKIWVESEFGQGSNFKFTLPVASAKILLVDDSTTDRILYSKILKNITPDYDVDVAVNGKEALEKILEAPPALVITDHTMPVMNGYNLVKEIQNANIKGKPPIIILSGDLTRGHIQDYNDIGIEYVFTKPVDLSSFKAAVEKSLRSGLSTY